MFGYIGLGNSNVRIHRDITGLPDGLFGGWDVVWGWGGCKLFNRNTNT
jgi:hypothetical protein